MHKHVTSKATYPLTVHRFTTPQVGKGGKRRKKFSLIIQKGILGMHEMVIQRNLLPESTPGHKQVKETKINTFSHITHILRTLQYAQTKANLPPEGAPVHNTASG